MSGALEGRIALVTGGGSGIGEGIVRRFAEEGARVVLADRGSGQTVATSVGGLHVATDVSDRRQIEAAVEATVASFGGIDILVNNAWSGGSLSRVETKTDKRLARAMVVGYYGPFWAMRAAFTHMKRRGYGRVINMCSLNGVNAHMGTLEYNAAKEALRTLTRTAAREWAMTGVTVNAVCPVAKTSAFLQAVRDHPELEAAADKANPMGRIGDPYDDIAPVVVFLAGEAAATSRVTRCSSMAAATSTACRGRRISTESEAGKPRFRAGLGNARSRPARPISPDETDPVRSPVLPRNDHPQRAGQQQFLMPARRAVLGPGGFLAADLALDLNGILVEVQQSQPQ